MSGLLTISASSIFLGGSSIRLGERELENNTALLLKRVLWPVDVVNGMTTVVCVQAWAMYKSLDGHMSRLLDFSEGLPWNKSLSTQANPQTGNNEKAKNTKESTALIFMNRESS